MEGGTGGSVGDYLVGSDSCVADGQVAGAMAKIDRQIRHYFDECYSDYKIFWHVEQNLGIHAGFYDRNGPWPWGSHNKAVVRMNRVLAEKVGVKDIDKVLDAGCGIGGSAIWLAKNIGCKVTAIDINDRFLEAAARLARKDGVNDLLVIHNRDFSSTGFPDNSFDVIWALESLCHAADKAGFLREAKRLLRANGRIVVAEGFVNDNIHPDVRTWLDGWAVPSLASITEFWHYLSELGFRDISFEDITWHVMPSSRRLYWLGITLYPLGKLLEFVRIRTTVQTANIISAIYQHRTLIQGLWRYGIFRAENTPSPN